jgi:hypothetical protein
VAETLARRRKISGLEDVQRVRDAGVAGSNPATPTMKLLENSNHQFLAANSFANEWRVSCRVRHLPALACFVADFGVHGGLI